jgi:hypothetical protein
MQAKVDIAATATVIDAHANTGRRIKITGFHLVSAADVTVKFVSGSTDLTGAMTLIKGVPHSMAPSNSLDTPEVLLCAYGEAFKLTLGSAVQVSGWIIYEYV